MYVPYCTSDGYSGRRDASDETGGYAFHGKIVVEAVINDLLDQVLLVKTSTIKCSTYKLIIHTQRNQRLFTCYDDIASNFVNVDLSLQKVVGSKSIGQFLLTGISAGAFGAAFNCDKVITYKS